jgi:hypothetical protein
MGKYLGETSPARMTYGLLSTKTGQGKPPSPLRALFSQRRACF